MKLCLERISWQDLEINAVEELMIKSKADAKLIKGIHEVSRKITVTKGVVVTNPLSRVFSLRTTGESCNGVESRNIAQQHDLFLEAIVVDRLFYTAILHTIVSANHSTLITPETQSLEQGTDAIDKHIGETYTQDDNVACEHEAKSDDKQDNGTDTKADVKINNSLAISPMSPYQLAIFYLEIVEATGFSWKNPHILCEEAQGIIQILDQELAPITTCMDISKKKGLERHFKFLQLQGTTTGSKQGAERDDKDNLTIDKGARIARGFLHMAQLHDDYLHFKDLEFMVDRQDGII